jgi:hypothetical protein
MIVSLIVVGEAATQATLAQRLYGEEKGRTFHGQKRTFWKVPESGR